MPVEFDELLPWELAGAFGFEALGLRVWGVGVQACSFRAERWSITHSKDTFLASRLQCSSAKGGRKGTEGKILHDQLKLDAQVREAFRSVAFEVAAKTFVGPEPFI